jgi:hypothetical protein
MVNKYDKMLTTIKVVTHVSTIDGQHHGQLFRAYFTQIQRTLVNI